MSNAIYPVLPGLGYSVKRTPQFKTRTQASISGKEVRIADWSAPRYTYELTYEFLRQTTGYNELKTLQSFYLLRQGGFDTFLYDDIDDDTAVAQGIGVGDGVNKSFQLIRSYSGWVDVILAPNAISTVYLNGIVTAGGNYTVSQYGASNTPGIITFITAPAAGVVVTATFSFYFPCRFVDDVQEYEKFMNQLWLAKKVQFITVK